MSIHGKNAVRETGEGENPIVFVHGLGCDQRVWHYVAPRFERAQKVVLYDLAGFGFSDAGAFDEAAYSRLDGHAADLIAICEAQSGAACTVVGHSLGGMIALVAASLRPELFRHVILLSVSPCHLNIGNYQGGFDPVQIEAMLASLAASLPDWSAHMAPVAVGEHGQAQVIEELEGYFCQNRPERMLHQARLALEADIRDILGQVMVPCTALRTWDDPFVSAAARQCVAESLPDVAVVDMVTYGHYPHLNDPEVVAAAIKSVLAGRRTDGNYTDA